MPVETLHLSPPDGDDFGALSLYCHAIGATLKHLTLDLEFATSEETMRQGKLSCGGLDDMTTHLDDSRCWIGTSHTTGVYHLCRKIRIWPRIRQSSFDILAMCLSCPSTNLY